MSSWLDVSPLLNGFLLTLIIFNAMAVGPKINGVSNLLFSMLFANIIATALVALW